MCFSGICTSPTKAAGHLRRMSNCAPGCLSPERHIISRIRLWDSYPQCGQGCHLSNVHIKGWFYNLTQFTWRHVQADGLKAVYKEDDTILHCCGMLNSLAFLPVYKVHEGMAILRLDTPEELSNCLTTSTAHTCQEHFALSALPTEELDSDK